MDVRRRLRRYNLLEDRRKEKWLPFYLLGMVGGRKNYLDNVIGWAGHTNKV